MIDFRIHTELGKGPKRFELNVEAQFSQGEIIYLQGDSGAGKSTLLKALAGLYRPDNGYISIDGTMVFSPEYFVPAGKRDVALQLQELGLFPSKSVERNIGYCYEDHCPLRVQEILDVLDLDAYRKKKPHQLSGGQRQRVGLARALAQGRRVLLLDEPLNALDEEMRNAAIGLLKRYHEKVGGVIVITSHHAGDLASIATREIGLAHGALTHDRAVVPSSRSAKMIGKVIDILKGDRFVLVVAFDGEKVHIPCSAETASAVQVGQQLSLQYDISRRALRVS